jgi:hypothetical protein
MNKDWIPVYTGMTDRVLDTGLRRYDKQGVIRG